VSLYPLAPQLNPQLPKAEKQAVKTGHIKRRQQIAPYTTDLRLTGWNKLAILGLPCLR